VKRGITWKLHTSRRRLTRGGHELHEVYFLKRQPRSADLFVQGANLTVGYAHYHADAYGQCYALHRVAPDGGDSEFLGQFKTRRACVIALNRAIREGGA